MNRKTHSHYYVQVSSVNYFLICSTEYIVHTVLVLLLVWFSVFSDVVPCSSRPPSPYFVAVSFPTSLHNLISLPRMLHNFFLLLVNLASASIHHLCIYFAFSVSLSHFLYLFLTFSLSHLFSPPL